jgi:hypothetical protein
MGTKETYQKEVEEELERVELGIRTLMARAEEANKEIKHAYDEQIEALQAILKRAQKRLGELKSANHENWEDLRPRLEGVLSELRNAVANVGVSLPPQSYRSGAVEAWDANLDANLDAE